MRRLALSLLAAACLVPARAQGQPSFVGEFLARSAQSARCTALGGETLLFASGAEDFELQPAASAWASHWSAVASVSVDRLPFEVSDSWSVAASVPLSSLDPRAPALSVSHRRFATRASFSNVLGTLDLGIDADMTTVGAAFRAGPDWTLGVALHALSPGPQVATWTGVLADSSVAIAGSEDLLFAASLGAQLHRTLSASDAVRWDLLGALALRRFGEDGEFATTDSRSGASALVPEVAGGVGLRASGPSWDAQVAVEVATATYANAPSSPPLRAGAELRIVRVLSLRAGYTDDEQVSDWSWGVGVALRWREDWRLGLDLANEASRRPDSWEDRPWNLGVRLSGPLGSPDPAERGASLDELLDTLEDMLDEEDGGSR
jgi:hypothetical protein